EPLFMRAAIGPGFMLPIVALDDGDEVEQLAAAHRVVKNMRGWRDPAAMAHQLGRQLCGGAEAAPRHEAGEARPVCAEEPLADHRVNAIRADQRIARNALAGVEDGDDALAGLLEADAALAE